NFMNDNEADHIQWLDFGRDNYAGVTWSDIPAQDGRRIMIGWMSNWKYANDTPTGAWRGAMTLPRTLSLTRYEEQLVLTQLPVQEVEKLRKSTMSWDQVEVTPQSSFTSKTESALLEIEADIDVSSGAEVTISLQATGTSEIIVGYNP